ncbi:MAG: hypothetical protein ABIG30_02810 [Candidatus Aenigmatarchaeota archaeon]
MSEIIPVTAESIAEAIVDGPVKINKSGWFGKGIDVVQPTRSFWQWAHDNHMALAGAAAGLALIGTCAASASALAEGQGTYGIEAMSEFQHSEPHDYQHFGFSLFERDGKGNLVYGDRVRFLRDELSSGMVRTNVGVRLPFDFGYKGDFMAYGLDASRDEKGNKDDGAGVRVFGSVNDWLLNGVFERAELGGKNMGLEGLGIGRVFHVLPCGDTRIELWQYHKSIDGDDEIIRNLFALQNFPDKYSLALSLTDGEKVDDLMLAFGRGAPKGGTGWRVYGRTALDGGKTFSLGTDVSVGSRELVFIPSSYGLLNTESGAASQSLWKHAMGFYPDIRPFERAHAFFSANYTHNKSSDTFTTRATVSPFALMESESELLRGVHFDGAYILDDTGDDRNTSTTFGAGMTYKGFDAFVEKTRDQKPLFLIQYRKDF